MANTWAANCHVCAPGWTISVVGRPAAKIAVVFGRWALPSTVRGSCADHAAELERKADSAALRLAPELLRGEPPERPAHGVALYEVSGDKVTGHGPARLERPLTFLEPDAVVFADTPDKFVVLVAIGDGSQVLAARRLGGGDFTVRAERAGIPEIDSVGSSLDSTARRLADLLANERAFSADASHQLRTPLAGLRLQLESAVDDPGSDRLAAISASLATTDRLERTIDDLLALARDTGTGGESADTGAVLDALVRDWQGLFTGRGRVVRLAGVSDVAGYLVSAPVLRQVVSVLLDNALRHGRGTVTVSARDAGAAVAVDVTDEYGVACPQCTPGGDAGACALTEILLFPNLPELSLTRKSPLAYSRLP